MKSINATLAAAQKTASAAALARVSLADNDHLHLTEFNDAGAGSLYSVGCIHAGAIVRVRRVAGNLAYQRITDPNTALNWEGWTALALSNVGFNIAIFTTGDYVVVAWKDSSDSDIKYIRSATGGGSWSAAATAYTLAGNSDICGVDDAAGVRCGLFRWNNNDIAWCAYDDATDTWAAAATAGLTLPIYSHIGAAWDTANSRWIIALTCNGFATGSYAPVCTLTRSAAGAWSTPRVWYLGATNNTTDQGGLHISQAKINGYWWMTFWRYKWWADTSVYLARSDDGEYWEEITGLDVQIKAGVGEDKFMVIGELGGYAWAANERWVFRSTPQTFWSNQTVRTYELLMRSPINPIPSPSGRGAGGEGGVLASTLTVEVDNSGGALADPEMFSVLTLERGYSVGGTAYYRSAGTFYVVAFEYVLQDNLLRVQAVDAAGLLFLWRTDQAFRWEGETVQVLVTLLCALAGVHSVSFDANSLWAETVPAFSINPGVTGYHALQSLAQRAAFNLRANEDGSLYFYIPTAAPASQHTYGSASGEHLHWPGRFGRRLAPNYILVLTPDVGDAAESHDFAAQSAAGRRLSASIYEQRISASAGSAALAVPRLVHAQESGYFHDLEAPPNFALEVGDIITVNDGGFGEDNSPWRAAGYDEYYNPASLKNKFFQRVYLRGTT